MERSRPLETLHTPIEYAPTGYCLAGMNVYMQDDWNQAQFIWMPAPFTPAPTAAPTAAYRICDLGEAALGDDVTCEYNTTVADYEYGTNTEFAWPVKFIIQDSANDGSWCYNPRLTFSYVENDFAGTDTYLKVYESTSLAPGNPVIGTCGQNGAYGTCVTKTCFTDRALSKDYFDTDTIDFTIYASAALEGIGLSGAAICPGGYLIDATLTLKCTRAITRAPTKEPTTSASPTNAPSVSTTGNGDTDDNSNSDAPRNTPICHLVQLFVVALFRACSL